VGLKLTKSELREYIIECLKEKDNILSRDIRDMIEKKTGIRLSTMKISQMIRNMTGSVDSEKEYIHYSTYIKRYSLKGVWR